MPGSHESNGAGGDGFDITITGGSTGAVARLGRDAVTPTSVAKNHSLSVDSALKQLTGASAVLIQRGGQYEILKNITGAPPPEGEPIEFDSKTLPDAGIPLQPKVGQGLYVTFVVDSTQPDFIAKLAKVWVSKNPGTALADAERALQTDLETMSKAINEVAR